MPLYQGEPEALAYFDSFEYHIAMRNRSTWDPAMKRHTYDEVCTTEIYTLKTEEWHEQEGCQCYGSHPTHVTSVRWSKTAEKVWLTKGFVPSHGGVVSKHHRWATRYGFKNQLITEEDLCPA